MTFITGLYKSAKSGDNSITYNFNKSINQYFISGIYNSNTGHAFKGVYNNKPYSVGLSLSMENVTNNDDGSVVCNANNFVIGNRYIQIVGGCTINAVIIYPAIYGDVTIS